MTYADELDDMQNWPEPPNQTKLDVYLEARKEHMRHMLGGQLYDALQAEEDRVCPGGYKYENDE